MFRDGGRRTATTSAHRATAAAHARRDRRRRRCANRFRPATAPGQRARARARAFSVDGRAHKRVLAVVGRAQRHDAADAQLLVDIDLSILGSPAERFERYDQDVRKEYAWVPGFRYQEARAQVLQSFLDRPRLYHGEHAVALLEAQARINLAAALSRLAQ